MEQNQDQGASLKNKQCGRCQGLPHISCPIFPGLSPFPLPTGGTSSPKCPGHHHDAALSGQDPLVS